MSRRWLVLLVMCAFGFPAHALAQANVSPAQGGMQMPMPMPDGDEHGMTMAGNPLGIANGRDGSGTSWQPDTSPAHGLMREHGPWMLMLHGNAFVQFVKTGTDRGDEQFGSVNWLMGMARRDVAGGPLTLRLMMSAEAATVGRCGYPALLQSGEVCRGAALHDRQHPHDLFMELAADYRRAISQSIAFEVYGGPAAEPALGPSAFAHRPSALPNPGAPISHHWLDSSHISFGALTGALYGRRWKAEASVFNGREPDDRRWGFDLGALDSYSARLWFLPNDRWALQASAGHLKEAELRAVGPRQDVDRLTASATYHVLAGDRLWATTVAWGQNREREASGDAHATSAFMAETAADLTIADTVFARGEIVGKTAEELVLPVTNEAPFTVGKFQTGYTRWLPERRGLRVGVGGSVGLGFLPQELAASYGRRAAGEFNVFLTIRPR